MNEPSRILIVDDMPESLSLLARTLDAEGFELRLAKSGEDALRILRDGLVPHLVLCDMVMPGMDGIELCRRLKSDEATRRIPVLFLSSDNSPRQRSLAFEAGGVDYVLKPFSAEEVIARVRIHLRLVVHEVLAAEMEARARLEAQLGRSQALAHVGTWSLQDGRLEWSREMYSIFDVPPNTVGPDLTRISRSRVHPEDLARVEAVLSAATRGEMVGSIEHRIVRTDGSVATVWVEFGRQFGEGSRPHWGTVLDVTERRLFELERDRLTRELEQVRKFEALGRLAGGIAHSFNNTVMIVQGHADLGIHSAGGTRAELHFRQIHESMGRTRQIVAQLMGFARHQPSNPRTLDFSAVVGGLLPILRLLAGDGIEIRWTPCPLPAAARIDPGQLEQILTNLVANARDAMEGTGTVEISVRIEDVRQRLETAGGGIDPGRWIVVAVRDDGPGFTDEVREHLFEPFFTTKPQGKGTGLGLATNWGIVRQNGGSIRVPALSGRGALFEVYLPADSGVPAAEARAPAPERSRVCGNVLVVDDDPMIAELVRRILETAGWGALVTTDPRQALELVRDPSCLFDLVLSDVMMPHLSGPDLVRHIRDLRPGVPCLLMSGYTGENLSEHVGRLEDGFLEKPFGADELLPRVTRALEASRRAR